MTRPSYKERERLRREQEILWTAARIIHEHGYASLNMDTVAETVGVSKPTLYQHFKSKDEMVIGTMIASADHLMAHMDSVTDQPPLKQIELILRYLIGTHIQPKEFPATFVHEPSLAELESYQRMLERRRAVGIRLHMLVQAAQQQGQIPAHIPPMVVISALFSMLGILRGPDMMNDHSVDAQSIIEGIVHLFLHGITAK